MALDAPSRVERLVLIGAVGVGRVNHVHLAQWLPVRSFGMIEGLISRWTFRAVLRRAYGSLAEPTDRDIDEYYAPTSDPNALRALSSLLLRFDWRVLGPDELARFSMPVLIIGGTEERIVTADRAERVAAQMPNARVVLIEGAGHVVNEEAPEPTNRAMVDFLAP